MVKVCIIAGYGINADMELSAAFEISGSYASRIHIKDIIEKPGILHDYDILAFPGGFSFGDHLGSGKVFANLFRRNLKSELDFFIGEGKLVIGICNGFQVLVKMGILPNLAGNWMQEVSLVRNLSGKFEDRWVKVCFNAKSRCVWTAGLKNIDLPVRHGEGRFVVKSRSVLDALKKEDLVAAGYIGRTEKCQCPEESNPGAEYEHVEYPDNPNGSVDNIAGICDRTGRVFGLMPHPEAFLIPENHPQWARMSKKGRSVMDTGLLIFKNGINYMEEKKGITG
ncbi:MAG: phosphoribosylformylglycinamidine synthase subunit PurQ [Spirochaetes bacterium]|nr:phosphoribosylformylglycinamidine synthase subunit PurQ [Spirochaetota bacterium]